ncbi:hypothetical protein AVEN_148666-1 [Araneus ventricosus]|uniref:DUF4817 domain-containing protein n=1 Tax=Araneus ventricosus TaxID=182803 RepID=A0A4Y2G7W5_ARAVE|nr:hypothetical protein AVEN_148666-1 [Araneus ventricosus]
MHLIYGRAGGNGRLAQTMYQEQYPRRRCPHRTTFANIDRRLLETGPFEITRPNAGQERSVRTPEEVSTSAQSIAAELARIDCTKWCGRSCVLKTCTPSTCRKSNSYAMTITLIA